MLSPLLSHVERAAFICGCGHTGTTLLATILSMHAELYVPLNESSAFLGTEEQMANRLKRLDAQTHAAGKTYLVEKTPRHIRRLGLIRRTLPGSRFVILVRDGRDVTASIANRHHGDFQRGLERWVQDTDRAVRQRGKADAHIVRYEDLVADPPAAVARVCGFLGIPYADALLRYHETPHYWYGRKDVRRTDGVGPHHEDLRNWQVNQPIFDGRGRGRETLPPDIDVQFRSGRPRELMDEFGYGDGPAVGAAASAAPPVTGF